MPHEPSTDIDAQVVLRDVNRLHGTDFELVGAFDGGRQGGALRVRSRAGRTAVFKWTRDAGLVTRIPQARADVSNLRRRAYPTPGWLVAGATDAGVGFVIQELGAGLPGTWLTVPLVELCAVIELQAGLGHAATESWSSYVEWLARDPGGPRRFLGSTPAGRDLVAHFDEVLRGHGSGEVITRDLVHGDLNTSNVLVADGYVSAVIDIEAIGSGTRAIDYAWLLREGFTVGAPVADLEMIRRAGVRSADPAVFATCVAATAFDITAFEARMAESTEPAAPLVRVLHSLADFVRA